MEGQKERDAHFFVTEDGVSGSFWQNEQFYILRQSSSEFSTAHKVDLTSPEYFDLETKPNIFLSANEDQDIYMGPLWCDKSANETCNATLKENYVESTGAIGPGCVPCIKLDPGEEKIYIQLEIDHDMIRTFAKREKTLAEEREKKNKKPKKNKEATALYPIPGLEAAVDYLVNLYSMISHDIFHDIGIDLLLCAIHVHRSNFDEEAEKDTYMAAMRRIPIPDTCHLVHGLSTRWINGGRASANGLYINDGYAIVGDIRGDFDKYDRKLVAHETGHNLGLHHANDCTLMTQTHHCDGGLKNIKLRFSQRHVETMAKKLKDHHAMLQKKVDAFEAQSNGIQSVSEATLVGYSASGGEEEEEVEQEEVEEVEMHLNLLRKDILDVNDSGDITGGTSSDVDSYILTSAIIFLGFFIGCSLNIVARNCLRRRKSIEKNSYLQEPLAKL